MAKAKAQKEGGGNLTGKLTVSLTVTNFNGADHEPVIESIQEVPLYDGEDTLEAAKRAVAELAKQTTA